MTDALHVVHDHHVTRHYEAEAPAGAVRDSGVAEFLGSGSKTRVCDTQSFRSLPVLNHRGHVARSRIESAQFPASSQFSALCRFHGVAISRMLPPDTHCASKQCILGKPEFENKMAPRKIVSPEVARMAMALRPTRSY